MFTFVITIVVIGHHGVFPFMGGLGFASSHHLLRSIEIYWDLLRLNDDRKLLSIDEKLFVNGDSFHTHFIFNFYKHHHDLWTEKRINKKFLLSLPRKYKRTQIRMSSDRKHLQIAEKFLSWVFLIWDRSVKMNIWSDQWCQEMFKHKYQLTSTWSIHTLPRSETSVNRRKVFIVGASYQGPLC